MIFLHWSYWKRKKISQVPIILNSELPGFIKKEKEVLGTLTLWRWFCIAKGTQQFVHQHRWRCENCQVAATEGDDKIVFKQLTCDTKEEIVGVSSRSCVWLLRPQGLELARLFCTWDFLARILEWVAIPFSGGSPPRDQTCFCWIGRWILHHWATREAQKRNYQGYDHHTHSGAWKMKRRPSV